MCIGVGVTTGLRVGGFGVYIPVRTEELSNFKTSRPSLEATQLSIQMLHGFFRVGRGGKNDLSEGEFSHSFPCSAEVKNDWKSTSFPAVCLHGFCLENFTSLSRTCTRQYIQLLFGETSLDV